MLTNELLLCACDDSELFSSLLSICYEVKESQCDGESCAEPLRGL